MLRLVLRATQGALLSLAAYNAITGVAGWRNRPKAPRAGSSQRFRVVIPAHNEAHVVGSLLSDLHKQEYPSEFVSVSVLADRCSDATAEVARSAGVSVVERTEGTDGKGAAIAWLLSAQPLADDESLVVLDADNRVPPDLLSRFSDEIAAGHHVLQAYLDVTNPDSGPVATAGALSYWAGNRMVQLARSNLGWSADLGGTGMCLTSTALLAVNGFGASITEDQELGARLALAGIDVQWIHDVRIYDEKPSETATAIAQRARWAAGKKAVFKRYGRKLLRKAVVDRQWRPVDQALRLVQPGRSFVALATGLLGLLSWCTRSRFLLPAKLLVSAATIQVLLPIPFLARDGVDRKYLARYPLLAIIGGLWGPVQVAAMRVRGDWFHTPHVGSDNDG